MGIFKRIPERLRQRPTLPPPSPKSDHNYYSFENLDYPDEKWFKKEVERLDPGPCPNLFIKEKYSCDSCGAFFKKELMHCEYCGNDKKNQ